MKLQVLAHRIPLHKKDIHFKQEMVPCCVVVSLGLLQQLNLLPLSLTSASYEQYVTD